MTAVLSSAIGHSDPANSAASLFPLISDGARSPHQNRGLPDATVDAFHNTGLYRALAPRDVGGGQCGVEAAFDAIENVSRADGAAGWVLMAGMTTLAIAGAYLGDSAVAHVFGDARAVTAGQVAPLGTAERTDDGVRVQGRFGFSSGSQHASWIFGGYREQRDGTPVKLASGMPNVLGAIVPKDKVVFLGNWDVLGLQHTWSEDYEVPSQVIPEDYTFSLFAAKPLRGGPGYGIGVNGLTCIAHSAWACGVARRILDELKDLLVAKRNPTRKTLIDDSHFQHEFAMAEAALQAARSQVISSLVALEQAALQDNVTLALRSQARLATSFACNAASQTTAVAYRFAGSAGLRKGVIQQCYLDLSAGEQHIFTDHNSVATAGKVLLGLASPDMFF